MWMGERWNERKGEDRWEGDGVPTLATERSLRSIREITFLWTVKKRDGDEGLSGRTENVDGRAMEE